MCLLFDALLGLSVIAFGSSLSPGISTHMSLSSVWRKTKTVLVNGPSLDAPYTATYSASRVAVVTLFCVLLFQPMTVTQLDCYTKRGT